MPADMAALAADRRRRDGRHPRPGGRAGRGRLAHADARRRAGTSPTRSAISPTSTRSAVRSAVDPEQFQAELAAAEADGGINPDTIAARFRDRTGAQLLAWFEVARADLIGTFAGLTRAPGCRGSVRP